MGRESASASVWPPFVALGLALAEVGVLFGLGLVAVGGVLLFGRGCAGIACEAGLARRPWRPLWVIGGTIGVSSALVWALRAPSLAPSALAATASGDAIAIRAAVVLAGAALLVIGGALGPLVSAWR